LGGGDGKGTGTGGRASVISELGRITGRHVRYVWAFAVSSEQARDCTRPPVEVSESLEDRPPPAAKLLSQLRIPGELPQR
jgi:hypothetical protein